MPSPRLAERQRVGVDAAAISVRGKGVARYLTELLPRLALVDTRLELVVLAAAGATLPPGAETLERYAISPRPASVWEQVGLPLAVRHARLDLVHSTSDRLPLATRARLAFYLFEDPRYRAELARGRQDLRHRIAGTLSRGLFPISLRRAGVVLVSSEATARDVVLRGIDAERVRVVYPGVSETFRPARDAAELTAIRTRLECPDGYVLHFSSDDPRDNTGVALAAYAEVVRRDPGTPPLLVPGPVVGELAAQQEIVRSLGIGERVTWLGYRSGNELTELYRGAAAYLDSSLFEGFGFQVAEALASGLPVACSNTTSLPEVVGDAGVLVGPNDVKGFADALAAVLADRSHWRELGPKQVARFRWERTATETVAVWEELLA